MDPMTDADRTWEAFAEAIVRIAFDDFPKVLEPAAPAEVGEFPFEAPVHIITAYNPAGVRMAEDDNARRHRALGAALAGHETVPTVGSARDGSMAEPGYAVFGLTLGEAVQVGDRFGQRAIYRWTADALSVIGIDEPIETRLGWRLTDDPPGLRPLPPPQPQG